MGWPSLVLGALLGQQEGGGPLPLPQQAAGPARYARTALERRTFHAYFVLATVQKELAAPALALGPALISHPSSSQLAS